MRALGPGDVVAGKYRVERVLGEGGMGIVLGALHVTLGERVALKVLRPEAITDAEARARFLREARAAARMKGDHVARVLDVESPDEGTPYIAMEYLEGTDLACLVETQGVLPVPVAVDYVLQACEALAEAHALGIVHRDVKPSNLFLTRKVDGSPLVKVLDFGISKATSAHDANRPDFDMTATHSVLGSPAYMAPEQMRSSKHVDGRTDIWAVGTILHELLTARPPFESSSMPELCAMILQDPAPALRERRPDVPAGLEAVVARCLEKSPDRRFESIHELAAALAPFGGPEAGDAAARIARMGRPVAPLQSDPRLAVASSPSPISSQNLPLVLAQTIATTTSSHTTGRPRRHFAIAFATSAALALVAVGVAVFVLRSRVTARPATAETPASVATSAEMPPAPPPTTSSEALPPPPSTVAPSATASALHARTSPTVRAGGTKPKPQASTAPAAGAPSSSPKPVVTPPSIASSRYD